MEFTLKQRVALLYSYVVRDFFGFREHASEAAGASFPPANGDFTQTRGNVPSRNNGVISEKEHDAAIDWLVTSPPLEE